MMTAYETVVHSVVIAPVFVLAGLFNATTRVCRAASTVGDRLSGERRHGDRVSGLPVA